ncbi:MAG: hydantoinase/oxoprolinase family protein [Pseudomonadota bacterium]
MFRIGVDVGGTFTDITTVNEETGEVSSEKVLTTRDPSVGVLSAIKEIKVRLSDVKLFVHGTTVGINALIEGRGPRTGLLTTEGFEDILEIGRANRPVFFDIFYQNPPPLAPRKWRMGVPERIDFTGRILKPVDMEKVRSATEFFSGAGVESVAICFLNSYANSENERVVADFVRKGWPRLEVTASFEVLPEIREYERTSTTVICAYLKPVVRAYLERLEEVLANEGCRSGLYIMQSSGGVMTSRLAKVQPVHMLESGPAGGAVAAQYIGNLLGEPNVIGLDMGGTTCKGNIVTGGELPGTTEYWPAGYMAKMPIIDIVEIGIGGGSIGWIDQEGFFTVGPKSAGADPGPVCYGLGGTDPTITDANLVLGRVESLVGGRMRLDKEKALEAILQKLAGPLNLDPIVAARGILDIAINKMAELVRTLTMARGYDPRDYILFVFGGAGPMHGAFVAAQIGIPKVLIPPAPGTFSGLGFLCSDFRHDFVKTYLLDLSKVDPEDLERSFHRLEEEGIKTLRTEGFQTSEISLLRSLDMRYVGQAHEVTVSIRGPVTLSDMKEAFHRKHEITYGHAASREPVEIVNLRVGAVGKVEKIMVRYPRAQGQPSEKTRKRVFFSDADGWVDCPVYDRATLPVGYQLQGPAVIEEHTSTTVVPPHWICSIDTYTNIILDRRK